MSNTSGEWLPLPAEAERRGISKEAIRKKLVRFVKTKGATNISPYDDAYKDEKGHWYVHLPERQPEQLEVVEQLPAIPTPDNHELLQRLAAIGEVLERQQEHNERLVARIGELERENGRLQAQLEARESTESDEAAQDAPQHVYTLPEPQKRPWWQLWKGR